MDDIPIPLVSTVPGLEPGTVVFSHGNLVEVANALIVAGFVLAVLVAVTLGVLVGRGR